MGASVVVAAAAAGAADTDGTVSGVVAGFTAMGLAVILTQIPPEESLVLMPSENQFSLGCEIRL